MELYRMGNVNYGNWKMRGERKVERRLIVRNPMRLVLQDSIFFLLFMKWNLHLKDFVAMNVVK